MRLRRKIPEPVEVSKKRVCVPSTRKTVISTEEYADEELFENAEDFPDAIPMGKKQVRKIEEELEEDSVNLIGDKDVVSDASMAIRALLGEGGDFRAGSEIDEDQVRALLTLLDVAEELNSPRLLKTAENFLLLRISSGGKGRGQVVSAFKGLYEPTAQPGMQQGQGNVPSGTLRGVR
jgi:hypothetical protein